MSQRELGDEELAYLDELAYLEAAEMDSPNSPDFDRVQARIFERLCEEASRKVLVC